MKISGEKYRVTGMSCAACSAHVERAVRGLEGVQDVQVNLLTNSMIVSYDEPASSAAICEAVERAGYGASPVVSAKPGPSGADARRAAGAAAREALEDHETPLIKRRLIASLFLLIPLMYVSMGHSMWGWPLPGLLDGNPLALALYEMILAAAVMIINNRFFVNGFRGAVHGGANMDTLVAMGSAAGFIYSTAVFFKMSAAANAGNLEEARMLFHGGMYFESSAMIVTLITVGKMLEAMSKGRTTDAIKSLMDLAPKEAHVLRDGTEITVAAEEVEEGDIFIVRPGESFPVDGVVVEGESAVNEAALTGESLPVDKAPGSSVSAATINQNGSLSCRATRVGADTTLQQIIDMVQNAAATKAPVAKVADRVAGIFVPAVMVIAAADFIIWMIAGADAGFALGRAISVLVISCPCALGLATPVAIMVGSGLGARNGILFKTASSLEATGAVRYVVLDKTGTITEGRPRVTDIVPASGVSEEDLLRAAASLEARSEHPLAEAVREYAAEAAIEFTAASGFSALPGHGIRGTVEVPGLGRGFGDKLSAIGGNAALMKEHGILSGADSMESEGDRLAGDGKTPLYFAAGGRLLGIIAVADVIKEDSRQAIAELTGAGVRPVMLTGDNSRTARAIGRQLGLDAIISDVLPDGKEAVIMKIQEYGRTAMVGDGINDAPALTRADVGIAIGAGADVAIDAADVVLMRSSLRDVAAAIRLSRQTLRNIHENLFWAFFYNVICIPIAAGALIPRFGISLDPMFGAAAMSLSSIFVVANALRLNLFDVRSSKRDHKYKLAPLPDFLDESRADGSCPIIFEAAPEAEISAAADENTEENMMKKEIKVSGMMCQNCVAHVSKALMAIEGVSGAEVSLENANAVVTLDRDVTDEELRRAVAEAGYEAGEVGAA